MKELFKPFFIALVILISTSNSYSQLTEGNVSLSLQAGRVSLNGFEERNTLGFNLDFTLKKNIGMHYNINFGEKYLHTPLASAATFFVMKELIGSDIYLLTTSFFVGILFAIVPEGISYNIAFNEKIGISPYVSPLQFNFIKKENQQGGTDSYAGGALGLKFNWIVFETIRISPFGEFKMHYNKDPHFGTYAGIDIGYRLIRTRNND